LVDDAGLTLATLRLLRLYVAITGLSSFVFNYLPSRLVALKNADIDCKVTCYILAALALYK